MSEQMGSRLAVRRLTLTDFRCYGLLRLETDARPVVLTGPNGAGKTNLLEALSFLTPGRGMRRASLADVLNHKMETGSPWAVSASLEGPEGIWDVGTGREAGSERRIVRINGEPARAIDLGDIASALWITPAMDRIFTEGASGRRRFLDRLVLGQDKGHAKRSSAYEHAMRERNRLLKASRNGARFDPSWALALEDAMAENGTAIAAARLRAVEHLAEALKQSVGPFPAAKLALKGDVEDMLAASGFDQARADFKAKLAKNRRQDETAGGATLGVHRTDLEVRHAGKNMPAALCSTGEQKAVLVAMVLAQSRVRTALTGLAPILLLDEVVAHLDDERRRALFDELAGLNAQSWLTGTDEPLFAGFGERAQFFRVAEASVHSAT